MSVGIASFNPKRLTQAREARGLYATALAEMVGLSNASISKFERGLAKPTEETLLELSRALNVPPVHFTREAIDENDSAVFYRSLASATKQMRTRAYRKFEWFSEICDFLETYFDFPKLSLPQIDTPEDFRELSGPDIERAAAKFRSSLGIKGGPLPNLLRLLEEQGVLICRAELGDAKFDAFNQIRKNRRPYIFLGTDKESAVRSRFDLGHELGHILLHQRVNQTALNTPALLKLIEKQAHRFASALFLPEEDFTKDLTSPTLDGFKSLKLKWKVSIGTMIARCKDLRINTDFETKRLWINLNRRGWKTREPFDDEIRPEKPSLPSQCIKLLLENNVVTKDQILDHLALKSRDVEELCSLPEGFFEKDFGKLVELPRPTHRRPNRTTNNTPEIISFPSKPPFA